MNGQHNEKASDIRAAIIPSAKTIKATYDSLKNSVDHITADSQDILYTLQTMGDLLNTLTGSTSFGGGWSELGMIGLPIPIAMKTVTAIMSQYVSQKTGISFRNWVDFVNSARIQFEDYLAQLAKVTRLSTKYEVLDIAAAQIDLHQIGEDEQLLRNVKLKTTLWKPVMGKVAQLGQLVDAILESKAKLDEEEKAPEPKPEKPAGVMGSFQKVQQKVGEVVKEKTAGEQAKIIEWILSPAHQLRDRTRQLSSQTDKLSRSINVLEDLLDLEIAQIQAYSGQIPAQEVEVLSQRVAATILVPQLRDRLAESRHRLTTYQGFLSKLSAAQHEAQIGVKAYQTLAAEYQAEIDATTQHLRTLETQANAWKNEGNAVLDSGLAWMHEQLEVTRVRQLIGQLAREEADQRTAALTRELNRLEEARRILL